LTQNCFPFYKKLKKVAKFLSSAKESAQADQWEDCVDNANRILKNEPDVQNIRFHAYDRYKKVSFFENNLATKFLPTPRTKSNAPARVQYNFCSLKRKKRKSKEDNFCALENVLRGFLFPTGHVRVNV